MPRRSSLHPAQDATAGDWFTRQHVLVLILIALTVLGIYLCFRMVVPFLPAIAWAVVLAVVARPLHAWLARRIANSNLAAALAVVVVALLIIVPAGFVAQQVLSEAAVHVDTVQAGIESGVWRDRLAGQPMLAALLAWAESYVDLQGEIRTMIASAMSRLQAFLAASLWTGVQLLLTLLTLFFLFRDHRAALTSLRSLTPLSNVEADEMLARIDDTVHATIYGTLVMALIQGALGGLMFWWLGLPAPVLWGAVMALLAVVPYLGAFVVWVPAAISLLLAGAWGKALILTLWGGVVVALIDNLLFPVLVGKRLRMHTLLVFFALFGGLTVFGAAGVVLGPVVLAVTLALIDVWRRRTEHGSTAENGVEKEMPATRAVG